MKSSHSLIITAVVAGSFMAGCAARTVKPQQSFDKLKPLAAAPPTSFAPNLIVHVNNVRDAGKSSKNSLDLFINGQKVLRNNAAEPNARDDVYELSLGAGVYKIEAIYHTQSFWKDKDFKITTQDGNVRIYPDYLTRLAITLDKKPDGSLKQSKNFFSEIPQSLRAPEISKTPEPSLTDQPVAPPAVIAEDAQTAPLEAAAPVQNAAPSALEGSGKVAMQINTSPSGADIIIDDKYFGQSPVTAYIDRGQNHVLQISKEGYAEVIKWIDQREFAGQKTYLLIEKLEAQK